MPSPVQMLPAAAAAGSSRAAPPPEAVAPTASATSFRDALGDVQRRTAPGTNSDKGGPPKAAARAKPVPVKKASTRKPARRGDGSADRAEPAESRPVDAPQTTRASESETPAPKETQDLSNNSPGPVDEPAARATPAEPGNDGAAAASLVQAVTSIQPASDVTPSESQPSTTGTAAVARPGAATTTPDTEAAAEAPGEALGGVSAQAPAEDAAGGAAPVLEALEAAELTDSDTSEAPHTVAASPAAVGTGGDASTEAESQTAGDSAADAQGDSEQAPPVAIEQAVQEAAPLAAARRAERPTAHDASAPQPDPLAPPIDASLRATPSPTPLAAPAAPPPPPEVRFADANHPRLITAVRSELLPDGGTMQIRLDPPELGDLLVSVELRGGVVTASFQTSNDDATRLLSHSLADLKGMLEQQGVTVDRLQVRQSPRDDSSGDPRRDSQGSDDPATAEERDSARRDQHRRDLVQKMWDRLAGRDPLDLVA